jgi:hypothetical protein
MPDKTMIKICAYLILCRDLEEQLPIVKRLEQGVRNKHASSFARAVIVLRKPNRSMTNRELFSTVFQPTTPIDKERSGLSIREKPCRSSSPEI